MTSSRSRARCSRSSTPRTPRARPGCVWFKTRKGRGYGIYDAASHGKSHGRNSEGFWACREAFASKYGVTFEGHGDTTDPGEDGCREQSRGWFETVFSVLRNTEGLAEYVANTLLGLGESIPAKPEGLRLDPAKNMHEDRSWLDQLPEELFLPVRCQGRQQGRLRQVRLLGQQPRQGAHGPAAGARLLGGPRRLHRHQRLRQGLRRQEELRLVRAQLEHRGLAPAPADHRVHERRPRGGRRDGEHDRATPEEAFVGYWGACSTYGSVLLPQVRDDAAVQRSSPRTASCGSGRSSGSRATRAPETAEDSRTHFGVFAPAVTQLFPEGQVINLRPWEHNEVAAAPRGGAQATDVPIIALHLTRPGVVIPDRKAAGDPEPHGGRQGRLRAPRLRHEPPQGGHAHRRGHARPWSRLELLPSFHDGSAPNCKIVADLQLRALHGPAQGVPRPRPAQVRLAGQHRHLQRQPASGCTPGSRPRSPSSTP